jgi:uncharacterized membrane protein YedE/YeeE
VVAAFQSYRGRPAFIRLMYQFIPLAVALGILDWVGQLRGYSAWHFMGLYAVLFGIFGMIGAVGTVLTHTSRRLLVLTDAALYEFRQTVLRTPSSLIARYDKQELTFTPRHGKLVLVDVNSVKLLVEEKAELVLRSVGWS